MTTPIEETVAIELQLRGEEHTAGDLVKVNGQEYYVTNTKPLAVITAEYWHKYETFTCPNIK